MKSVALSFLLLSGVCCFADDTNIIAASDWSEPVFLQNLETLHDHAIRGRLLIVAGNEPGHGGWQKTDRDNATMTFVELQNVTGGYSESAEVCFDEMRLKCDLADSNGKPAPKGRGFFDGRGSLTPSWEVLPYNSAIRLFVDSGTKSPMTIWGNWSIPATDTNIYYLSGTLEIFTRTNESMPQSFYDSHCKGTLIFPKTKISANKQ